MKRKAFPVKLFSQALLIVVSGSLFTAWASCMGAQVIETTPVVIVKQCGRGALLDAGGQRVLLLAGSPYEMGFQHGKLLKDEVRSLSESILQFSTAAEVSRAKDFLKIGSLSQAFARTSGFIDRRFHEEMAGLAAGAELDLKTVQLTNVFPELFHCSGLALFSSTTETGELYHGRILDYMTEAGLQNYAVVTIAKPDGYNAFVTVGYAGFVGSVTAMNEKQISLGEMGGGGGDAWDGIPMSFLMRKAAEEADTLEQAVAIFQNAPRTCEYYYVLSDAKIPDARGLVCRPDEFQVIEPGKSYEQLPLPIEDAVLMSAGTRYENLAALVKQQHGKISVDEALDLMNRPVAMESCLHRVLFAPKAGQFWVANAADSSQENYPACYQPYYRYDFAQLLSMIPDQTPQGVDGIVIPEGLSEKNLIETAKEEKATPAEEIVGTVLAGNRPQMASTETEEQQLLSIYPEDDSPFEYRMKFENETPDYKIYNISFPSSYESRFPENNTVYCEYYRSKGGEKRPVVIVLDILDGSMFVSRIFANSIASSGTDACIMTLPYYNQRKPQNNLKENGGFNMNIDLFIESYKQAVFDVRRTARLLASLDQISTGKIGICGTSLGGFVAALASGVDGNFQKTAFVLAGGDMKTIITSDNKEVADLRNAILATSLSDSDLIRMLAPIEPLNFASRLKNSDILMINGTRDTIVPPNCAKLLAESTGANIKWYDTDHYGMAKYLLQVMGELSRHFKAENWK